MLSEAILRRFGVLLIAGVACSGANIVTNGSFETGTFSGWTVPQGEGDFNCVANVADLNACGSTGATGNDYVHSGQYGAFLGWGGGDGDPLTTESLSQTFLGLDPGSYEISFYLTRLRSGSADDGGAALMQFLFAGSQLGSDLTDLSDLPVLSSPSATRFTFDVPSFPGGDAVLQFNFYNIAGEFGLDDVCVAPGDTRTDPCGAVPEPTSLVLSGIPLAALWFLRRRK